MQKESYGTWAKGLERVDNKASILPGKSHDHRVLSILQANISGLQTERAIRL